MDSAAVAPAAEAHAQPIDDDEHDAKRRRIRKGTHSCWECKRRKVRCNFASAMDATCVGCARRGVSCISQEFPEEAAQPSDSRVEVRDRIVRVEKLLSQLVRKAPEALHSGNAVDSRLVADILAASGESERAPLLAMQELLPDRTAPEGESPGTAEAEFPTPRSRDTGPASDRGGPRSGTPGAGKYHKLSLALHAALPSQEDLEALSSANYFKWIYSNPVDSKPPVKVDPKQLEDLGKLAAMPSPDTHPVLLAKWMLSLASYLQTAPLEEVGVLSENVFVIKKRLADTAISLVTTNDELHGTIESLECIVLEAIFQSNGGNLRRGWLAYRRALMVGQLMGIDRADGPPVKSLDPTNSTDPRFMWFRIIYMDRFLSLILAKPQGSCDMSICSEAALAEASPTGRLERVHAAVAGRILERNERGSSADDFAVTQELDAQLLRAARGLPDRFWLPPKFGNLKPNVGEGVWQVMRLIDQLYHYTLLHFLHLPYLLRFSAERKYEYSKITCVNASREILTRFVNFRTFNRITSCCRPGDFFALMASMTLLIAHLDSHRHHGQADNVLAHQRLSDRAMMEQVLENMEYCARLNEDALSGRSADLLRRLLWMEGEAAKGLQYSTESIQQGMRCQEDGPSELCLAMPYCGTVKITPEGISKESSREPEYPAENDSGGNNSQGSASGRASSNGQVTGEQQLPPTTTTSSVHFANHILALGLDRQPASIPPPPPEYVHGPAAVNTSPLSMSDTIPSYDTLLPPQTAAGTSNSGSTMGGTTPFETGTNYFKSPLSDLAAQQPLDNLSFMTAQNQPNFLPGLSATMDDWVFQGVDSAFFDNVMRGASLSMAASDQTGGGSGGGMVPGEPSAGIGGGGGANPGDWGTSGG